MDIYCDKTMNEKHTTVASCINSVLSRLKLRNNKITGVQDISDICFHLETLLQLHSPIKLRKWLISSSEYVCVSNSPFISTLAELALDYQEKESSLSSLLSERVHYLVSIPTILSNELVKSGCGKNYFDATLFIERLCDAVLIFLLQDTTVEENTVGTPFKLTFISCSTVSVSVIQTISKLGHAQVFLHRLKIFLQENNLTTWIGKQLTLICAAIFEMSVAPLYSNSPKRIRFSRYDKYFVDFLVTLLGLIDTNPCCSMSIEQFFSQFQTEENWNYCLLAPLFNSFKSILWKSLFSEDILFCCPSRQVLAFLFNRLLQSVEDAEAVQSVKDALSRLVKSWGSQECLRSSTVEFDSCLMSTVIYIIMFYIRMEEKLPLVILSDLLEGVSLRLGNSQNVVFREHGMTVAAAYASLAVDEGDAQALLENEDYQRLYREWLRVETSFISPSMNRTSTIDHSHNEPLVCRDSSFPMNPDEEYFFYAVNSPVNREILFTGTSVRDDCALKSFGLTERKEDKLDKNVEILTSIKQCYNSIVGIGRNQNAQLVEIQQSIESGLRGFQQFFELHGNNVKKMEETREELGPLSPSLLRALINLSLHAPDAKLKELLSLRYSTIVNIIVLSPKVALHTVSSLLYSGTLGIVQRAELARAIGDAAISLANTEIPEETKSSEEVVKRIYPPMNDGFARTNSKVGRNVRRWGYAAHTKKRAALTWNRLADVSSTFVEALLSRSDADHFKFFQESDPYTPSEILRSLIKIFQSITSVSHIAQIICKSNIDFFIFVITVHKIDSVRKLGWMAFEEVMRCWCGAPPHFLVRSEDLIINKVSHYQSSTFSNEWLNVLNTAEELCKKLASINEPCAPVAIHVVSNLRDLVNHHEDVIAISNNYSCSVTVL